MSIILDGTGTGNIAKVDSNNRLRTQSISLSTIEQANILGNAYNINTGEITLTSADESAVLYLKNNETDDFYINSIVVGIGPSTGGTEGEPARIKIMRNPTTGTLITNELPVEAASNRNFGSSNTLTADIYQGVEGDTFTNGSLHALFYQVSSNRLFATIEEELPKGSSIGITIEPPTGNTSVIVYVALIGYLSRGI